MSLRKPFSYCLVFLTIAVIVAVSRFTGCLLTSPSLTASASSDSTDNLSAGNFSLPSVGKSTSRELSSGEVNSYQFTVDADQYLQLIVSEHGIDLGLTVYAPSGQVLTQIDCRYYEPTPLSFVSETAGTFRLEIRSLEREPSRGRYELRTEEIRPARPLDHDRIAGQESFAEAEWLLRDWKVASMRQAIERFKESLPKFQAARDLQGEILSLKRIGDIHRGFGEYQPALDFYRQALSLSQRAKHRSTESEALSEIGYVYVYLGANQEALKHCTKALSLSKEGSRGEAQALNNLGEVHSWSGELQRALDHYGRALPIWTQIGDRRGQAQTYLYLGYTHSDLGQMREAFDFYNQALSIWQTVLDSKGQAMTLTALGRLYSRIGENQEALRFFEKAMKITKSIGDPMEEGNILSGLAYIDDQLGEKKKAINNYTQASTLFKSIGYSNGEAITLYDAGRAYFSLGDYPQALSHFQQALSISRRTGDRRVESLELREIGKVHDALGNKAKALDYYQRAISFWRSDKDFREMADTLNPIGHIYEERGQKDQALEYYEKALRLSRQAEFRYGEATTLLSIARVQRDSGKLFEARQRAEEALRVLESVREKVDSQDLRTSFFASVRQQYEFYIDVLMRLHKDRPGEGFDAAAFDASERARARSLLETLTIARVGVRRSADPGLLQQELKLSKELNDKAVQRMNLKPGSLESDREAQNITKQIDELTWELREVEARIRTGSIEKTASLEAQPLGLKAVQDRVVGVDTLLLEYSLGEEKSYLWAISKEAILSYELPKRAEIESLSRNVYDALTTNQTPQAQTTNQPQDVAARSEQLQSQINKLSDILLAPVEKQLGTKRLLIVADGALQYIPFQILTKPADSSAADSVRSGELMARQPLVNQHEIVNQSSASALALLMGDTDRPKPSNSVAVFADPVFESDDPRISSHNSTSTDTPATNELQTDAQRALRDVGLTVSGNKIPRLRASQDEADAIMKAAPWGSGLKVLGFQANRTRALSSDIADYRIVHFATHGLLNNEHPELSGIVLSLFDQKGQQQDGFLRLHDIYNLKLPVELVVLSACNTGLGKDVKGEGLIGLTRGFMYAGASSVVASLWKVDDEATAELMRLFYDYMLSEGLSPAAALRKAQMTMSQQKRWESPYYWAGFVIQGQYLQTDKASRFPISYLAISILAGVVLGAAGIYALKRRRKFAL